MNKFLYALPLLAAAPLIAHEGSHAAPAGAAPMAKAIDLAKITGGNYTVESTHALIGWRVNHFGFNDYFGIFGSPTGTLVLNKADPAKSSVTIDIPISGLSTASEKLTGHMKSKDFFNAETNPSAKFVSTMVMVKGQAAMIHGNLTILGVTKPVVLDAKLSGAGTNMFNKKETVGFHAKTTINRSDWGMTYAVPAVSNAVELDISVAFEKQ
jgi:polyisoprenoid-binding protein YceI